MAGMIRLRKQIGGKQTGRNVTAVGSNVDVMLPSKSLRLHRKINNLQSTSMHIINHSKPVQFASFQQVPHYHYTVHHMP